MQINLEKSSILLKLFGSTAIIAATIIFSVIIQNIDNKLNSISENISRHKIDSIYFKLSKASFEDQFLERRINLLERNNRIIDKAELTTRIELENQINELEHQILDTTKIIIINQAGSLRESGSNISEMKSLEQKLDSIIIDPDMSINIKIKKLEPIREKTGDLLDIRFQKYQSELKKLRKEEKDHKERKLFWNSFFIWLQVLGLIALSFGELLGSKVSFHSIKEKTAHDKTN